MVKVESFLALDASLSQRLSVVLKAATQGWCRSVQDAIDAGDFEKAVTVVKSLRLSPMADHIHGYVAYASTLAALFGASQVNPNPETSGVGLGVEQEFLADFIQSFKEDGLKYIQDSLIADGVSLIDRAKATGVFHTVRKADATIRPFESAIDASGKAKLNIASSLHQSRLSAYGFTAEARHLGITEFQINEQLDGRACPVCRLMHGKVFKVQDARGLLSKVLRTQDPDALKELQPWPPQDAKSIADMQAMTPGELVAAGWHIPPFHARCRGLLSKVIELSPQPVTSNPNTPIPAPVPTRTVATEQDFQDLGISLPSTKVSTWNQLLKAPPLPLLTRVLNLQRQQAQTLLAGGREALGLRTLAITPQWANMELLAKAYGSHSKILLDLYFTRSKSLYVGSVDLALEDSAVLPSLLQSVYGAAKEAGMDSLQLSATGELGGYAWAKYGFAPSTPLEWKFVKRQITDAATLSESLASASEFERKVYTAVMASDTPTDIYALADLPILGKALLSGLVYTASLPLDDQEAMARFITAMGD